MPDLPSLTIGIKVTGLQKFKTDLDPGFMRSPVKCFGIWSLSGAQSGFIRTKSVTIVKLIFQISKNG